MPRFSRRWRTILTGTATILALLWAQGAAHAAVPGPAPHKISKAVLHDLTDQSTATFLVHLKEGADLSAATNAKDKGDKAAQVYKAKNAYAASTQAGLRKFLTARKASFTPFWIVNAVKVTGDARLAREIAKLPEVHRIEADRAIPMPEPVPGPKKSEAKVNAVEWNVDRIGARRVWSEFGTRGEDIVVASIDTGVQFDHPALAAQYRGRRADGTVDHNYNWYEPGTTYCPLGTPCDLSGHGTHTMGTMVGGAGTDIIGVAPGATWIAAQACLDACWTSDLLAAGQWVVAPTDVSGQNPRPDLAPHVVNNSWSGDDFHPWSKPMIDAWIAAGIFPVFSAGDSGPTCNSTSSPGADTGTYSAGAFDIGGAIAHFSSRGIGENHGIKPNVAAPGVNIRSSVPGDSYDVLSGTSMAAPHVAGTVALLWSAAPTLKGDVTATRELLDHTAADVADTSCGGTRAKNNVWGEGRLDAYKAVQDSPTGETGGLTGTVTSGGARQAQVAVTVAGPMHRTVVTNTAGAYTLPHLKIGTYQVTARKIGYADAAATVTVTAGSAIAHNIPLTARPTRMVSGTVTVDGAPDAGAVVAVGDTPVSTTTDASGRYRLAVPPGDYELTVTPPHTHCSGPVTTAAAVRRDLVKDIALPRRTDAFGYTCVSGKEPYVAGTGKLPFDDRRIKLPFPFLFYGGDYTDAWVSPRGWLSFLDRENGGLNRPTPSQDTPKAAVIPFWDELSIDDKAGIYTATVGNAPDRTFVVEWRNAAIDADPRRRISFSALLGEDGSIGFRYRGAGGGAATGTGATVGLSNHNDRDGFQYSFNQASLTDGQSLTFTAGRHGLLSGKVTDANDGRPLAGAFVNIGDVATLSTGVDGTFTAQVPAGDYRVSADKAHYGSLSQVATVTVGKRTSVGVALSTGKVTASVKALDLVMAADSVKSGTVVLTNRGSTTTSYTLETDPARSWLSASPAGGKLGPGASAKVTVTVRGTKAVKGSLRTGELLVRSTSGRKPLLGIPVSVIVPKVQIAVDVGSKRKAVDSAGEHWSADRKYTRGRHGYLAPVNKTHTAKGPIHGTRDGALFKKARESMTEYRFDKIPDGVYTVELGFAETRDIRAKHRVMDVRIEGEVAVPALDLSQEVGLRAATVRQFTVKVLDGQLNVQFTARTGTPILNTIRVWERPDKNTR
ncbi:S8 family serine peptidase [Sinosporangium siamense]|uniref:alpha-amylase n=1 Tax=Sinosporangium siamense TaxID=1367973 RepID=A0A919RP19_9ACTN|nr:S8 family serine peptidase [Sinosporangium siamense]GII97296.1 hypothetical protein Ssi02_75270 [Sinosporangium siamense]